MARENKRKENSKCEKEKQKESKGKRNCTKLMQKQNKKKTKGREKIQAKWFAHKFYSSFQNPLIQNHSQYYPKT